MSDNGPLPTVTLATVSDYCDGGFMQSAEPDPTSCERWAVPMTTQFVIPDNCDSVIPQASSVSASCQPEGFFQVWWNDGYYSPAVCPEGYAVACTVSAETLNYEPIYPSETAAMCLPSGFMCDIGDYGTEQIVFWGSGLHTDRDGFVSSSAAALQIRWTEDDLDFLPFHPMDDANIITELTTTTTSTTSTTTTTSTSTRRSLEPDQPSSTSESSASGVASASSEPSPESSGGAPVGAIAGGVVGGVAALALIGVLIFLLVRRRNQKKASAADQQVLQHAQQGGPGPNGGGPMGSPPMAMAPPGGQPYPPGPGGMVMMGHPTPPPPHGPYDPHAVGGMPPPNMHGGVGYPPVAYPAPTHSPDAMAHGYAKPSPTMHATQLANGNDMEVASVAAARSEPGGNEEWERQQLLQRQNELNERRARLLQLEQINQEEEAIRQRLSVLPPQ
ncbi:hypothetical protein ACRALDRAFT_1080824 [Sodiomyces alcalophilus JCM 7366]|uniref:uncharacterized protein n=1 Tax=Sodiomyces alcalophilus JCM 7366 TaxID=591952 RepID=UPI0039B6E7AC